MAMKVVVIIITCIVITEQAVVSKPQCEDNGFIDISNGTEKENKVIEFEGYQYNSSEYYYTNKGTIMGCVCLKKVCIHKCCPSQTRFAEKYEKLPCTLTNDTFDDIKVYHICGNDFKWKYAEKYNKASCGNATEIFDNKLDYSLDQPSKVVVVEKVVNIFHVIRPWIVSCAPGYTLDWGLSDDNYAIGLVANGQLWVKEGNNNVMYKDPDQYCIDTFVQEDENGVKNSQINALVCFKLPKSKHLPTASYMLISCFFIILTVAVYIWLPELRNLHGKVLMGYLISFLVAFTLMATMLMLDATNRDLLTLPVCKFFTFAEYYFSEVAYFWMNVMCFDIYYTFCGNNGVPRDRSSTSRRFRYYCMYALGVPLVLILLLVILQYINTHVYPHHYLPELDENTCFLQGQDKYIYFYGPMGILFVANIVFFLKTIKKIIDIHRGTAASITKNKESATNDKRGNCSQRIFLYIKLFCVMGINWSFELMDSTSRKILPFIKYIDAYNALIGVILFIVFVCKKKIFRLIRTRYRQARGASQTSGTLTSSTKTLSSRDEVRMSFIQNK